MWPRSFVCEHRFRKERNSFAVPRGTLKVVHTTTNRDSIVLQGAEATAAWSALIDRKTGALTVPLGDSQGVYVVFGQCKVTGAT